MVRYFIAIKYRAGKPARPDHLLQLFFSIFQQLEFHIVQLFG